jgi:hypothetical protein
MVSVFWANAREPQELQISPQSLHLTVVQAVGSIDFSQFFVRGDRMIGSEPVNRN